MSAANTASDAAAVCYIDEYLPIYYEVSASIKAVKPTGGWKANAYVIFDYFSPTDFKFAGVDVSTNEIVMGHRNATGWIVDAQDAAPAPRQPVLRPARRVNGTTVTVSVDGAALFT